MLVLRTGVAAAVVLSLLACVDNPHVIGRYDAGIDESGDASASCEDCDECGGEYADVLVCSGFEDEGLSAWDEMAVSADGELERSVERAHRGDASLHAISRATETTAVVARRFEPQSVGELYLRAYIYLPSGPPTRTMNLFFLGFEPNPDPPEPFIGLDLNLLDDALQVYSPQNDPSRVTGELTIVRDRWLCLRAQITLGDQGAVEVFVDDELALSVDPYDTVPDHGVSLLRAGVDWSSAQDEFFEVFIDDLVLHTQPVSCLM